MVLTSNKPFSVWGDISGDEVAAAMVDRLVHHSDVISLQGDSYRLKDRDRGKGGEARPPNGSDEGVSFRGLLTFPWVR